jgi:hypothetical protein
VEVTVQQEKVKKCSKEARWINCGGDRTAFSKDGGKRADGEKRNRIMTTKNIAEEARKIIETTDHRPPRSPPFRPTEDFPLFPGQFSTTVPGD